MATNGDALGDRMKGYESRETHRRLIPGLPVYARIDGRGFSKFTSGMGRPYDERMSRAMVETTRILVERTHATVGYVQSDEISLAWIPSETGHGWFDGKIAKMTSVLAGLASSAFMCQIPENFEPELASRLFGAMPHFDARVIDMPMIECANMFLWRNLDATKNAVSMAASSFYSHRELQGKSGSEKQEMMFQKGQNFNDYPAFFKRGTWVRRVSRERELAPEERARIPEAHRPPEGQLVLRTEVIAYDLPPLNKISNRMDVLFDGAEPVGLGEVA